MSATAVGTERHGSTGGHGFAVATLGGPNCVHYPLERSVDQYSSSSGEWETVDEGRAVRAEAGMDGEGAGTEASAIRSRPRTSHKPYTRVHPGCPS